MMRRDTSQRGRIEGGFSLIELGIVIAVIAILCGVVISGAGFIRASKERATIDLVFTIKKAAQQWAIRNRSGLSYGESNSLDDAQNVSIKAMRAGNFLPLNLTTPWESQPLQGDILAFPNATALPSVCAGFACVEIQIQVPANECTDPSGVLINGLQATTVILPTCSGTTLDAVMR
jgi:type II secretory pathway pseudopilin PulG